MCTESNFNACSIYNREHPQHNQRGSFYVRRRSEKMTKVERTARLRGLMTDHGLSAADVGEIVGRSPQTVRAWACKYPERAVPSHTLLVLELTLAKRQEAAPAVA